MKPVIVSLCCAIVFVIGVYFYGKHTFQDSEPIVIPISKGTVSKKITDDSPSTSESSAIVNPSESITDNSESVTSSDEPIDAVDKVSLTPTTSTPIKVSKSDIDIDLEIIDKGSEYVLLHQQYREALKLSPREEDFDDTLEYVDALLAHWDSIAPLRERVMELDRQYFQSLSPVLLDKIIRQVKEIDSEITDSDIDEFLKEINQ
jgi:hypothetical protein